MTQTIKVQWLAFDDVSAKEVSFEEAQKIVAETYARGALVVNKGTGEVIDEATPDIKEIMIIEAVGGG